MVTRSRFSRDSTTGLPLRIARSASEAFEKACAQQLSLKSRSADSDASNVGQAWKPRMIMNNRRCCKREQLEDTWRSRVRITGSITVVITDYKAPK